MNILVLLVPIPSEGSPYNLPQTFVTSSLQATANDYCQTWNQKHYRTFDGKVYSFPNRCTYLFAKDCQLQTFSIYTTNDRECYADEKCSTQIDIYVGMDHTLSLTRLQHQILVSCSNSAHGFAHVLSSWYSGKTYGRVSNTSMVV